MKCDKFAEMLEGIAGRQNIKFNEPMEHHTTFRTGGPADYLVMPRNIRILEDITGLCRKSDMPFYIIGKGSNLIISDKGIRGVVVKISDNLSGCEVNGCDIEAEAGASLSDMAKTACDNCLSGFEFASGIPGTIGGAVCMNAGAYGGQMSDVVTSVSMFDENGQFRMIRDLEGCFGYRSSCFQNADFVITGVVVALKKADRAGIASRMDELEAKRAENQPIGLPSAGSVFKRPKSGHYAWKLIEGCDLRGFNIGGACISEKHCGFIVNTGGATSADILELIRTIRARVTDKYGVKLETEIKIIGEW